MSRNRASRGLGDARGKQHTDQTVKLQAGCGPYELRAHWSTGRSREGRKKAFAHREIVEKMGVGGFDPLIERWIMVEKIINIYSMLLWSFHVIFIYAFFCRASFEFCRLFFYWKIVSLFCRMS